MLTPNPEYVRLLFEVVNRSPFPQHLPMALTAIDLDQATVSMTAAPCHLQPLGTVHGGVLATLIDTATYWAAFLRVPEADGLVNVDLKLNYLKPAGVGSLTAEGRCLRAGRTVSYAEASVRDEQGALVAHGTSTLLSIPGQGLPMNVKKFLD